MKLAWSLCAAGAVVVGWVADAAACGCFAPPASDNFAVNQQAEQIIFEVGEGTVSAHVRIFYSGDPEEFAWLLPMPSVPDLALSNGLLFGIVDDGSAPQATVFNRNLCPESAYECERHACDGPHSRSADAGVAFEDGAGGGAPPVEILAKERIGSYDTITFAADEADAAIGWLNDNGFIVNETMSPYMQPFLDAGMVFIVSRLVPGADLDELRPLRLTYEADAPSIPLQLTAVAAEPHMMVSAFIYAEEEYDPVSQDLVEIDATDLSASRGRANYPMLMSRVIDEAGGMAFVKEYVGAGPVLDADPNGCCEYAAEGDDFCNVAGDGVCSCPELVGDGGVDTADCADDEELVEAVAMARQLRIDYPVFTRLSTRISPEEMTFNPEFVPSDEPMGRFRLSLRGYEYSLRGCEDEVIEETLYGEIKADMECTSTYCDYGECVATEDGPGCACDDGRVARSFLDVDGELSVTCVPEVGTVDFSAGGFDAPDACAGFSVSVGECVDVGGFAAVACPADHGAVVPSSGKAGSLAQCSPIERRTGTSGARNYSAELQDLDVCEPPAPTCSERGWLVPLSSYTEGVVCHESPDVSWFEETPEPNCDEVESYDSGERVDTVEPRPAAALDNPNPGPTPEPDERTETEDTDFDPGSASADDTDPSASSDEEEEDTDGRATSDTPDGGAADVEEERKSDKDDGFCSVAPGQSSGQGGLSWGFALLALSLLRRRRR